MHVYNAYCILRVQTCGMNIKLYPIFFHLERRQSEHQLDNKIQVITRHTEMINYPPSGIVFIYLNTNFNFRNKLKDWLFYYNMVRPPHSGGWHKQTDIDTRTLNLCMCRKGKINLLQKNNKKNPPLSPEMC